MQAHGKEAVDGVCYQRRRPEETFVYELIEKHYPALVDYLAEQGKSLHAGVSCKAHQLEKRERLCRYISS